MKKYILLLTIFFIFGTAKAERIPREAWNNLRDIHAWHLENVDGITWDPKTADTDAFLCRTIKPYFFSIVHKNKELVEQNKRLTRERDEALEMTRSKTRLLTVIITAILVIITAIVVWFPISNRSIKRRQVRSSTDNLHCPRCGTEYAADESVCKNCKTHF